MTIVTQMDELALKRDAKERIEIFMNKNNQMIRTTDGKEFTTKKIALAWQVEILKGQAA